MQKLSLSELNRMNADEFKSADKTPIIIVLDNVRSLNNVGSVFRTSDAFRLAGIHLCGITSCPPNKEIHKTALGAEDIVEWQYFENTEDSVAQLRSQGYAIWAVEQAKESVFLDNFQTKINKQPIALIFGNEIDGVGEQIMKLVDGAIEIPQIGTKHSLNISVATGIVVWELFKGMRRFENEAMRRFEDERNEL